MRVKHALSTFPTLTGSPSATTMKNFDELLFKLKNLPSDTTLNPNHLIAVLEVFSRSLNQAQHDFDSYPESKLISEEILADWIDESISTLQKWRVTGKGPKFIKKPKNIAYRVGDVRTWIDNLTVASTSESLKLKR